MCTILDTAMCLLWGLTYTLVFVGTKKYRYALISPISQAIIVSFEIAVVFGFAVSGTFQLSYISICYIYWIIIEIATVALSIKYGFVPKRSVLPYILSTIVITCIMCYLVVYKEYKFFFSYFNTFVGEIIWLKYILKKDYPMKPIVLAAFYAKFIGDAISVPVYLERGTWLIDILCLLLPILDCIFIYVYAKRTNAIEGESE